MKNFIILGLALLLALPCRAQKKDGKQNAMDTVMVKGRTFLILADSSIYIENDTVIVLPDTVAMRLKREETSQSDEFYKRLKEKFYKKKLTKEIYDILFVDTKGRPVESGGQKDINKEYKKFTGKRIKNIDVQKLAVFGTDINDTLKQANSWAVRVANNLHVYTRSHIIKNNIFFQSGDEVDPDLLSDSERVLRNLPYIKDARIFVLPDEDDEFVNILIVVKDVWSISGELSINNFQRSDFAVVDKNFLGLGQELRNEFLYDVDNKPIIGYSGTYTINNIRRSFITGEFNYARSEPLDRIGVKLFRNFITPEIKYAGGLEWRKDNIRLERVEPDTTLRFFAEYDLQDYWFGRSWIINENEEDGRTNFQMAGGYNKFDYHNRPLVREDTNQLFFDRKLFLFSVGLSRRAYEKSALVLGYGRTEDIPKGFLMEVTAGKELNEFYDRNYLGWRFSIGEYYKKMGYLRPYVELGGFWRDGSVEQGALRLGLNYFSYLYRYHKVNVRQFFRVNYVLGIHRFEDEYLNINNNNGVRGLSNIFLRGDRKLIFNAETVAFTPFYIIGFRFAIFGFADLALVNAKQKKLFDNQLYQGYGIGLRLRNENLAFNTVQIRLAWYPVTPPDESSFGFQLSGEAPFRIPDFRIERPAVIDF